MQQYENPIIRGYYPDPSICRVGEDFYLVTSTFEFFPGVPVFHSKNLVDWEQINHCLVEDSQLPLENCRNSGGIFAPTIRHHNGIFYLITTNVTGGGNFIVTTKDIRGKWSEPNWIAYQGIDPSLFFDEDGKVYFCGTYSKDGEQGIGLFEINPDTGEALSPTQYVTKGTGGKFPEAPHLYKKDGIYYLMLAEGGTEYGHMVTILRSQSPYGPYEPCPHNPILSHRNAMDSSIQATGHGDLVEDQHGNWWMVFLGIRPLPYAMLHHLGRETFLAPVVWNKDGWPVVGVNGRVAPVMHAALPAAAVGERKNHFVEHFSTAPLGLEWNYARNPCRENYRQSEQGLTLIANAETLNDFHPTFLGVRQIEIDSTFETSLSNWTLQEGGRAGLVVYYNKDYHYEIYLTKLGGQHSIEFSKRVHDMTVCCLRERVSLSAGLSLRVVATPYEYRFFYKAEEGWKPMGSGVVAGLCTETTMMMTFTGVYVGLFASTGTATFTRLEATAISPRKNES